MAGKDAILTTTIVRNVNGMRDVECELLHVFKQRRDGKQLVAIGRAVCLVVLAFRFMCDKPFATLQRDVMKP